jgi:oxalate decarboxylase/phosphoglucose isomerase-like protein (cupin superfamily)
MPCARFENEPQASAPFEPHALPVSDAADDSAIVPRNAPHRFVNRSQLRAVTFNVYAPKAY